MGTRLTAAGLWSHWPRWPVTLSAVGVVVAGGAAAVAQWPHAWWWLLVLTAAAAAALPPAAGVLTQGLQRRQEVARTARAGLQQTTGADGGALPAVRDADLQSRVHRAVLAVPYIHRDAETAVAGYLRAGRPVLLIGPSMVGKTRLAAQVIATEFASWPVAIPDSKTALTDLDAKDVTLRQTVIWLDDLDRLLGAGGITDGTLRRLAADNVIIGTIRAAAYERFLPADPLKPPEWDVLSIFEHVFISRELSPGEQQQLVAAVTDPKIRDRISAVGLGEYVGAAEQVAEVLKLGAAGVDRIGYALVLGAADWRRCGLARPVPRPLLPALAAPHLDPASPDTLTNQDAFTVGLAWATRDINPSVSLLRPAGSEGYTVYDYALDLISRQTAPVPESTWALVIAEAGPLELIDIGMAAFVTYQRADTAAEAWHRAVSSGQTDAVPLGTLDLGYLREQAGDAVAAEAAYREAAASKHRDVVPRALLNLANLLNKQGDVDGSEKAFEQAMAAGNADVAAAAARALGLARRARGDLDGAEDAFQQAIASRHVDEAPTALVNLAALREARGDFPGAADACRQAIKTGHSDMGPRAWFNLGVALDRQGDLKGAIAAYRAAGDSRHAEAAPVALVNLGNLLANVADLPGAAAAYREAAAYEHAEPVPNALLGLGNVLLSAGDLGGAEAAYRHAAASGDPSVRPKALVNLGHVLLRGKDPAGAETAYRQAMATGDAGALAGARAGLAKLGKPAG